MIIKDGVVWASDAFDSVPMRYDDKKIEESKSYPTNGISIDGRKYTYLNNIDGAHIFKNGTYVT